MHNTNQVLIRAKDIGLLIAILTLVGMILGPLKKTYQWDETVQDVAELKKEIRTQSEEIAVTKSEFDQISKQLDQINWQLRRLNR